MKVSLFVVCTSLARSALILDQSQSGDLFLFDDAGDEFPSAVVNLDGCLIRAVARSYGGVSELMDTSGCFLVFGVEDETHEVALAKMCFVLAM